MAKPKTRWSSIACPLGFDYRLKFRMGIHPQPYHKYLQQMLDEHDKLYELNMELRKRLEGTLPLEEQLMQSSLRHLHHNRSWHNDIQT